MALDMLIFLVMATATWHAKKHHAQQAEAARRAAVHLRAAYQAAAQQPFAVLQQQGHRLPAPQRQQQSRALRTALPELADRVLTEAGWPALAATLTEAEAAGHAPAVLLAQATARRELDTAEQISDVLTWRLRRMADLPAHPRSAAPARYRSSLTTAPPPRRAGRPSPSQQR